MKKLTDAEIKEVQEARGTSRKMAIQWLKRNAGKEAAPAKAAKGKANIKTYPVVRDGKEIKVTIPEDEKPAAAAPAPEAPKAEAKPKRERGAPTAKRLEILASDKFKAAHAAALAKRKKGNLCKAGHDLSDPQHVHTGDLFRDGVVTCNTCFREQNAAYLARTAGVTRGHTAPHV